jgi:hypothetical protein
MDIAHPPFITIENSARHALAEWLVTVPWRSLSVLVPAHNTIHTEVVTPRTLRWATTPPQENKRKFKFSAIRTVCNLNQIGPEWYLVLTEFQSEEEIRQQKRQ